MTEFQELVSGARFKSSFGNHTMRAGQHLCESVLELSGEVLLADSVQGKSAVNDRPFRAIDGCLSKRSPGNLFAPDLFESVRLISGSFRTSLTVIRLFSRPTIHAQSDRWLANRLYSVDGVWLTKSQLIHYRHTIIRISTITSPAEEQNESAYQPHLLRSKRF